MCRLFPICLALLAAQSGAASEFSDFPASAYRGRAAAVQLMDARSRDHASALRAAARGRPNFAGHFVLATWGCGASCVMGAAIDARTGAVAWLPFTVCCWTIDVSTPLEYRRDSRMLIVHGSRDEQGAGGDAHYYAFDGRRFAPLAE